MYCTQCGHNLVSSAKFCDNCGNPSKSKPVEKAITVLSANPPESSDHKEIPKKTDGLFNPLAKPGDIIQIKCGYCNYIGKPVKWNFRTWIGVLYLFTLLNIIGILIYFASTNAYICSNCGRRDKLVKILNDGREISIKSLGKDVFQAVAIFFLLVGLGLLILRYSISNS